MKILVIQIKFIGDVLVGTILFELLKKKYPSAELHYLVAPNSTAVLENNPFIDKIIFKESNQSYSDKKLVNQIKNEKYDVVIDAYCKIGSILLAKKSGAKKIIAYHKKYIAPFISNSVRRKSFGTIGTTALEHKIQLLEPLDIPMEIVAPKIYLSEEEISTAKNKLSIYKNDNAPVYMISALGSSDEKTYPLKYMAELINHINSILPEAKFIFNYNPSQKEKAEQLFSFCNSETQKNILKDLYESDLRKFLALTSQCNALIGNEGGTTNTAKALSVPTFSIYSPLISKESWNMFEDGKKNISVQAADFEIDLKNKKEVFSVYQKFLPEMIIPKLEKFIQQNQ